jgi:hypothetical protein
MPLKPIDRQYVPAYNIISEHLAAISSEFSISETASDFDSGKYCFRLRNSLGRHVDLLLPEGFLKDLKENPYSPTSAYTIELSTKLDAEILKSIAVAG